MENDKRSIADPWTTIDTLINEVRQCRTQLEEAQSILYSETKFEGLRLAGGVKELLRCYREEQAKVRKLENEIKLMMKK